MSTTSGVQRCGERPTTSNRLLIDGAIKWVREKAFLEFDERGLLLGGFGITQDITALMAAQEALKESLQRERRRSAELETLLDTAPIGLAISLDPDGRHIEGNKTNEEMLGLPPNAELSKTAPQPLQVRVFEDDRELLPHELPMQRAIHEAIRVTQVLDAVRTDGRRLTLFANAAPLFDEQGNARGAVGAFLDITPLKQAEDALKATRDTFRDLVRNSPFGVYVVDADFRLWEVSLGAEKSFPNGRALIGCSFESVLRAAWPEGAVEDVMTRFRHTLATGEPFRFPSIVQRRRDSEETESFDWQVERIKLPDGRFGVVCNFYDLSERLRYERKLRASEARFRAVVEHAGAGICITNMEGRFEDANSVYCDCTGYSLEELTQLNFADLIHPEDRAENLEMVKQLVANELPFFEIENRYVRKGGDTIWVHKYISLVRDAAGTPTHTVVHVSDVTERRRMEQALREVDRRKDEFLATLAHELRNPLAPVHNAVQVLKKLDGSDPRSKRVLEIADRQVRHLVRLVDDLMDVARISRGKIELRKELVDLCNLLTVAVETSAPNITEQGHTIAVEAPSAPVFVEADPVRIVQIFANLLNNAARYTDSGGAIEIGLWIEGVNAVIRVRDNGRGIAPETMPLIFEPFTQGAGSERGRAGLGIGLALARGLVVMHKGEIEARSVGVGHGAEFIVRLPLTNVTAEGDSRVDSSQSIFRPSTLVVGDDRDLADSLAMQLRTFGARVEAVYSGTEALACMVRMKPEIVFIDIDMPGIDGYETAKRLRALPEGRRAMLIALTGWGQAGDVERAARAGFDRRFAKPADPEALLELLGLVAMQGA